RRLRRGLRGGRRDGGCLPSLDLGVTLFGLLGDELVGRLLRLVGAAVLCGLCLAGGAQPPELHREARPGHVDGPELLRAALGELKLPPAHGASPLVISPTSRDGVLIVTTWRGWIQHRCASSTGS